MENLKCRTCLKVTAKKKSLVILRSCHFEKTIKEAIIMLIPDMVSTLCDEDSICRSCYWTLKCTMKFIDRCLKVEMINAEEKAKFESYDHVNDLTDCGDKIVEPEINKIPLTKLLNWVKSDHSYYNKRKAKAEIFNNENKKCQRQSAIVHTYSKKHPQVLWTNIESEDSLNSSASMPLSSNVLNTYSKKKTRVCATTNSESITVPAESLPKSVLNNDKNDNHGSDIEYISEDSSPSDKVEFENDIIVEACDLMVESVICNEVVESVNSSSDVEDIAIFSCSTCSEKFSSELEYHQHIDVHPVFVCNECGKACKTKKSYTMHMAMHNSTYVMICEICGKGFKSRTSFKLHERGHKEERPYMCDICSKTFKRHINLNFHIKLVHKKALQHQCQECGKLFQTKDAYHSHYRLVHLKLKPYTCHVCGRRFGRKDYLRGHMQIHTCEPKPYGAVGSMFFGKQRAPNKIEFRLKNPGKPVKCKICGKTTSFPNFKMHLQSHFKRHKCKYCSLSFTHPTSRTRHEKKHVDSKDKFRCNICFKKLETEKELEKHTATHKKRPPRYQCDVCEEKFHRKYLLNSHILEKHKDPEQLEKEEMDILVENLKEYADPSYY